MKSKVTKILFVLSLSVVAVLLPLLLLLLLLVLVPLLLLHVVVVVLLVTVGVMYNRVGSIISAVNNILLDGENISFDANLVMYINGTNIPPILIMSRTYENQNLRCMVPLMRHTIVVFINNINPMYNLIFAIPKCLTHIEIYIYNNEKESHLIYNVTKTT